MIFVSIEKMQSKEDLDFMREMYPKPSRDQEVLVGLLMLKDVSLTSFTKSIQKVLRKLAREKSVVIKENKVKLTPLGTKIARGTKKIYGFS